MDKINVLRLQFTQNLDSVLNGRECPDLLWCFTELLMFLDHLYLYKKAQYGRIRRWDVVQLSAEAST